MVMVMVLLPVCEWHAEGSQCCHLLLCGTCVPLTGPGHRDVLVTMLLPGFWNAPGNNADLPHFPSPGWLTSHFLFHLIPIITFTFFFSNFVFPNR